MVKPPSESPDSFRDHVVQSLPQWIDNHPPASGGKAVPWLSQLSSIVVVTDQPIRGRSTGKGGAKLVNSKCSTGKAKSKSATQAERVPSDGKIYKWVRLPKDLEQCYCLLRDADAMVGSIPKTMRDFFGVDLNLAVVMKMFDQVKRKTKNELPGNVIRNGISALEIDDYSVSCIHRSDTMWLHAWNEPPHDVGIEWQISDITVLKGFVEWRSFDLWIDSAVGECPVRPEDCKKIKLLKESIQECAVAVGLRNLEVLYLPGGVRVCFT